MEYLQAGCASLIGVVFVVSAVSKLRDFTAFASSVLAFAPVRHALAAPLAMLIIALEAAVPALLAVRSARPYGFGLGCVLLAAFTAAIAVALRRGRRGPCRCFGAASAPMGPRHLARNGVLLAAGVAGGLSPGGLPSSAGTAIAVVAGLAGALLVISFDGIVDLFARSI
jgi:hypothetical protein